MARVAQLASRIARDSRFQLFIVLVIVVNGILVGVETSEDVLVSFPSLFTILNDAILVIFIVELAIRLVAYWPRPLAFFREGWNVFDFTIVALSLLPAAGSFATVARLARLLRVVRLVSVLPDLRLIVGTMLRSVSSMGPVVLLLTLLLYVYAVLGFHLFHEADPENWGTLALAMMSLFEILTLEGWVELQDRLLPISGLVWVYFGSYILIAVFMVVNLFIAVVLNNLEQVKEEHRVEEAEALAAGVRTIGELPDHGPPEMDLHFPTSHGAGEPDVLRRIDELRRDLDAFERAIRERGPA